MKTCSGMSLMELLVGTAILAVLVGITAPVVGSMTARAALTAEVAAAKRTIAAFSSYSAENSGEILPGYARLSAVDAQGNALHFPTSGRYPWRLAPYFDYDFRTLYVNEGRKRLNKMDPSDSYGMSVAPSFGMNTYFVGGNYEHFHPDGLGAYYGTFCVKRAAQAHSPSKLIVFASARSNHGGAVVEGYFQVTPPNITRRVWPSSYSENAQPSAFGNVHFRHNGRAVVAMLDGHVEVLDWDALQDMRRWADPAARADDPDWMMTAQNAN